MDLLVEGYQQIAKGIEMLFAPRVEVVLHDLAKNKINFITGATVSRKKGDPSHLSPSDLSRPIGLVGPYKKAGEGGEKQRTISIVLKGKDSKSRYMLCINFNVGELESALQIISDHISKSEDKILDDYFSENWQDQINNFIENYLRKKLSSIKQLHRNDKKKLVLELKKNGAFRGKNAAQYIADSLKISRASVYEYIKQ